MLRSTKEILGYAIQAKDGQMGKVHDIFFDDAEWRARYVVVDTRAWLPGRKVLISPQAVHEADWRTQNILVSLTREQIEKSPPIAENEPVSRRKEALIVEHFGWQPYWPGGAILVRGAVTGSEEEKTSSAIRPTGAATRVEAEDLPGDPHLRSAREVDGYHILAEDGQIGHVMDFVLEDETWDIRYLVIDTRSWFPGGKKVLLAPGWIERIEWVDSRVRVSMTKAEIKESPEYLPSEPVNREYEARLYDYYGRPRYWDR